MIQQYHFFFRNSSNEVSLAIVFHVFQNNLQLAMIMTAVIVDNDNITTMEHALITWTDREVFLFVDHTRSAGADHIIDI